MSVLRLGQGSPVALFPPGQGCSTAETRVWGDGVVGTQVLFGYDRSGQVDQIRHLRRQADRDAAEVVALADEHRATRAVGVSRGRGPSWARWRMTSGCSTGWCWSCRGPLSNGANLGVFVILLRAAGPAAQLVAAGREHR